MSRSRAWLRWGLIIAAVVVAQEALLRGLRIDGVRPDLLLAVGIVAAVVGGPERGVLVAFVAALAGDLFVGTPFGLSALVGSVVAFMAGAARRSLGDHRGTVPALTAVSSVVAVVSWAVLGALIGVPGLDPLHVLVIAAVVAMVNGLVALPLAAVARFAFAAPATGVPRVGFPMPRAVAPSASLAGARDAGAAPAGVAPAGAVPAGALRGGGGARR